MLEINGGELTQTQRVDVYYRIIVLKQNLKQVSLLSGVNYSTVRTQAQQYRDDNGRVNRLLNFMTKRSLLK